MRVLTVGNLYPPHHFGGYEQVWRSAVMHLRANGHTVRVLATGWRLEGVDDGDEPDVHRELRWYWAGHDFPRISLAKRPPIELHNARVLGRHLDDLDPDVVAFWSMGGMSHSLIERVRRRGIPMVAFVHDQWLDYGRFFDQWMRLFHKRRRAARAIERVTGIPTRVDYAGAGRYVFVSDFVRQKALALPEPVSDTAVAHSGIDPGLVGPLPPEHDWEWRLLYVGRIHPDKGIFESVQALTHLPEQATLSFAGKWDERDEDALAARARELGVASRVTMLGQRPPAEVAELMRTHDALLFPVVWEEPWGLVPIEAMAHGLPVIATGRGGGKEYLRDGENCLIVPAEDPEAIARAVGRLAEEPELRRALRSGGERTAPLHTETVFNEQVERHLTEVAGRVREPVAA